MYGFTASTQFSFLTRMIVAPYGQSDVKDLRSIFEVPHLRKRAVFLDTQCDIFPLVMYSS